MFYLFWSNKCSLNEHKNTFFQKKIQTLGPIFRILGHLKKKKKKTAHSSPNTNTKYKKILEYVYKIILSVFLL